MNYLGDIVSNSDRRSVVLTIVVTIVDISGVGYESRRKMMPRDTLTD